MSGTIADWEREQFEREAAAEIAAAPMTNAVVERLERATEVLPPEGLAVWAARSASGFYVQGLVDSEGRTYITTALAGKTETVEVDPSVALEAFLHPFAYDACTLPL